MGMKAAIADPTPVPVDVPAIEDIWSHEFAPGLHLEAWLVEGRWETVVVAGEDVVPYDVQGVAGSWEGS